MFPGRASPQESAGASPSGRCLSQPFDTAVEIRMDPVEQLATHVSLPDVDLALEGRRLVGVDEPLEAGGAPIDRVEGRDSLEAAGEDRPAQARGRLEEEARLAVGRALRHDVALHEIHREEGLSEDPGIRLVSDQGSQGYLAGRDQPLHGAVLDRDLDIEAGRLLRVDRGLGILDPEHDLSLDRLSAPLVADGDEDGARRESRFRQAELPELEGFRVRPLAREPVSKGSAKSGIVVRRHSGLCGERVSGSGLEGGAECGI